MTTQSPIESTIVSENPSTVTEMRKCAREKCPNTFIERGTGFYAKKYCSRNCHEACRPGRTASQVRRTKRYRETHPEWTKDMVHKPAAIHRTEFRRSGMTVVEFEARIQEQDNRCPIGNHLFGTGRGYGYDNPARDHCHETGKNRAILCQRHNLALGAFRDSPADLRAAAQYVEEWRRVHAE